MMEDVARDIGRFIKLALIALPIMAVVIVGLAVALIVAAA